MNCPVCRLPLVVLEYRKVELDYCPGCLGAWFDAGEIELLLEAEGLAVSGEALRLHPAGHRAGGGAAEAARPCPLCRKPMEKVSPEGRPVVLDRCPLGEGIWFDAGELARALAAPDAQTGATEAAVQAVERFLGAALAE